MAQPATPEPIVSLSGLGVTYPDGTRALEATSLEFRRGEFTVLLGLSGAGKSTLLRAINHLVLPTQGKVVSARWGALDSRQSLQKHRRETAMVFQHHHLIERYSALDNVLTGRLAYHSTWRSLFPLPRADLDLALQCLDRVGLVDKALTRVDRLSGGQRQRVGIARALAQQPVLILADEPVASLDPATSEKVLALLHRIGREDGLTTIVSLHQLEYAQRFADRIVGLANARVVFDGPPGALHDEHLSRIYAGHRRPSPPAAARSSQLAPEPALNASLEISS